MPVTLRLAFSGTAADTHVVLLVEPVRDGLEHVVSFADGFPGRPHVVGALWD